VENTLIEKSKCLTSDTTIIGYRLRRVSPIRSLQARKRKTNPQEAKSLSDTLLLKLNTNNYLYKKIKFWQEKEQKVEHDTS